ncbi:hypothetical protein [Clostridium botulinum]|uniref:hypothetical protein n=1 Tax=Clostridium botulinum TaxID=1491 RepID=UPI001C9A9899|nr:hypothetical protein [Clostridium botulinum]MBY6842787.1 hypothetical protein [Clostridium botulinum]
MCDYCKKSKSLHYDANGVIQEVYLESDKTLSITHPVSEFNVSIKIRFCPMCGKRLK